MNKHIIDYPKILIVTYYWPPSAEVAMHRWYYMSKHLAELGLKVTVLAPKNADYQSYDAMMDPKGVSVIRFKIFEVRRLFSLLSPENKNEKDNLFFKKRESLSLMGRISLWIRANIFLPDARMPWYYQIRRKVLKLIQKENFDYLVTTGPPHSVHLNGLYVKSKRNIKWIADFRDPWTEIEYHKFLPLSRRSAEAHIRLEKKVLEQADQVITVSPSWAEMFKSKGADDPYVVYNGYEESLFHDIDRTKNEDSILNILHIGTLRLDRNPTGLWNFLQKYKTAVRVHLYGLVSEDIRDLITTLNLEDNVVIHGKVDHKEALAAMMGADLLLLLVNKGIENSAGRIPAKIFEYIRTENPILMIGDINGDAAQLVKDSGGFCLDYNDVEGLYKTIRKVQSEKLQRSRDYDSKGFSRKAQAERFSQLLEQIT